MAENRPYSIGIDIGTGIGWATMFVDEFGNPNELYKMGVYAFEKSEVKKTGEPLNVARRSARSARRNTRRRALRKKEIKRLIISQNITDDKSIDLICNDYKLNPWELRVAALDRKLTDEEFARVLVHLAQRRGFKSNRIHAKSENSDDGLLLKAVNENKNLMQTYGYRTVAEFYLKDPRFVEHKRNKAGDYSGVISRDELEQEIKSIFFAQRKLGNAKATEKFEDEFISRLMAQRDFDEGPGIGSHRHGNQIEMMVGKCTFFPEEKRAASATYSNEYRCLLEAVNHIRIKRDGKNIPLNEEERKAVIDYVFAHKGDISYKQIKKLLNLQLDDRFSIDYGVYDTAELTESKAKIRSLEAYHKIKNVIVTKAGKEVYDTLSINQLDELGTILTIYKNDSSIRKALINSNFPYEIIEISEFLPTFDKFASLSVKACKAIIPFLEKGMTYDKACAAAGIDFRAHSCERAKKLKPTNVEMEEITSPTVKRAVIHVCKLINAITEDMGYQPSFINIEMARDITRPKKLKSEISKKNKNNEAANENARNVIEESLKSSHASRDDIIRYRLWKEQGERCAYSGKKISASVLLTRAVEVDHIIPYSLSFDDSYNNKVLVYKEENQNKGNRIPLQYLTGEKRDKFILWVDSTYTNKLLAKRYRLLKDELTEEDRDGFTNKNLMDTRHTARFLLNYIQDHMLFDETIPSDVRVRAVNGRITAKLRTFWGLNKDRTESDRHHAMDAAVISCVTPGVIDSVSNFIKWKETGRKFNPSTKLRNGLLADEGMIIEKDTGEVIAEYPMPWNNFNREIIARVSDNPQEEVLKIGDCSCSYRIDEIKPILVARVPNRKFKGAVHDETIMSRRHIDDGYAVKRVPLEKLKLDKITGEIADYYNPESDRLLYEALKTRLEAFDGDGAKAFKEPIRKPKADGTDGNIVNKVKIKYATNSYVDLPKTGGIALKASGSTVRVDIFKTDKGYTFVPIYMDDVAKAILPYKADNGDIVSDENFVFSLQKNDYVIIEKDLTKSVEGYFVGVHKGKGTLVIRPVNSSNSKDDREHGIGNIGALHKYHMDVLGNVHEIKKEKRRSI